MIRLLTREIKGSVSQTTLFHPLPVEKPVGRAPDEFLQLCSRCVDYLCARLTQNSRLNPKLSPHRSCHDQNTAKAQHPCDGEYDFLLTARHCVWHGDEHGLSNQWISTCQSSCNPVWKKTLCCCRFPLKSLKHECYKVLSYAQIHMLRE